MPRHNSGTVTRRWWLRGGAIVVGLALVGAGGLGAPRPAPAAEDVKIALVVPLSGRWARQGELKKMGAELAVSEINAAGGIQALGGARVTLVAVDAGDSVEKAVSAAQRVLTRERITAGVGSWLSSFTLGVTEVAERVQVPWLSLSIADNITLRGFKYAFQTSPVASLQATLALDMISELAKANGSAIRKVALVGDNTAAIVFFFKPLREKLIAERGLELVADEVWTPPLADATAIAQKLRANVPDLVFYGATNFPDSVQVLQKLKEFGVRVPMIGIGTWLLTPEYVNAVGKDLMEGIMSTAFSHPLKGQGKLLQAFREKTREPFMVGDSLSTYAEVWIVKEAVERAKSADPKKVRDAIAALDLTGGPAATALFPNRIKFDERGRRVDATPIIVQWQDGQPQAVFPVKVAVRPVGWPKSR